MNPSLYELFTDKDVACKEQTHNHPSYMPAEGKKPQIQFIHKLFIQQKCDIVILLKWNRDLGRFYNFAVAKLINTGTYSINNDFHYPA